MPFYFCPRSVMLYVIWKANASLSWSIERAKDCIVHCARTVLLCVGSVAWADAHVSPHGACQRRLTPVLN